MKYYSESETHIMAECQNCRKVVKIKKEYCSANSSGYSLNPPIRCVCGQVWDFISREYESESSAYKDSIIKCPKCGSQNITSNKKGFGIGKSLAGGLVAGPVGLLGGFIGSRKVDITCLKCGHRWKAG